MLIKDYQKFTSQGLTYPEENKLLHLSNGLAGEVGELADLVAKNYSELQEYHKSPIYIEYLSNSEKNNFKLELGDCLWYIVSLHRVLKENNLYDYHQDDIYLVSTDKGFEEYNLCFEKKLAKDVPLVKRLIDLVSLTGSICNITKKITRDRKELTKENMESMVLSLRISVNIIALIGLVINTNLNEIAESNVLKLSKKH